MNSIEHSCLFGTQPASEFLPGYDIGLWLLGQRKPGAVIQPSRRVLGTCAHFMGSSNHCKILDIEHGSSRYLFNGKRERTQSLLREESDRKLASQRLRACALVSGWVRKMSSPVQTGEMEIQVVRAHCSPFTGRAKDSFVRSKKCHYPYGGNKNLSSSTLVLLLQIESRGI